MVTYSPQSPFLYFWNLNNGDRQRVAPLPAAPAFLKFLSNSETFLVGYRERLVNSLQFYQLNFGMNSVNDIVLVSDISLQKSPFIP